MIEDFFDHRCNIFHLIPKQDSPGYGLPDSDNFTYADTPDASDVPCHFGVRSSNITITQGEPQNDMDARIKLTVSTDTDIQVNDKIVDCDTLLEYTAEQPRNIRGHHKYAYIKRLERQKPL